jgi:hypothetical protein
MEFCESCHDTQAFSKFSTLSHRVGLDVSRNPKYGRQYVEWNTTRWLLFSNHADAIPMPKNDRRFAVIANPVLRRSDAYYTELYARLDDPEFIAAVGWFLSQRDISAFNPGATPELNAAKLAVIDATTPDMDRELAEVVAVWESPVAVASDLLQACDIKPDDRTARAAFGFAMRRAGHLRLPSKPRLGGERVTVWLLAGKEPALRGALSRSDRRERG